MSQLAEAVLNPEAGLLAPVTSIIEQVTSAETGPLGMLSELSNDLLIQGESSQLPLVETVNDLLTAVTGDSGLLHGLGNLLGDGSLGLGAKPIQISGQDSANADLQPIATSIGSLPDVGDAAIQNPLLVQQQHQLI